MAEESCCQCFNRFCVGVLACLMACLGITIIILSALVQTDQLSGSNFPQCNDCVKVFVVLYVFGGVLFVAGLLGVVSAFHGSRYCAIPFGILMVLCSLGFLAIMICVIVFDKHPNRFHLDSAWVDTAKNDPNFTCSIQQHLSCSGYDTCCASSSSSGGHNSRSRGANTTDRSLDSGLESLSLLRDLLIGRAATAITPMAKAVESPAGIGAMLPGHSVAEEKKVANARNKNKNNNNNDNDNNQFNINNQITGDIDNEEEAAKNNGQDAGALGEDGGGAAAAQNNDDNMYNINNTDSISGLHGPPPIAAKTNTAATTTTTTTTNGAATTPTTDADTAATVAGLTPYLSGLAATHQCNPDSNQCPSGCHHSGYTQTCERAIIHDVQHYFWAIIGVTAGVFVVAMIVAVMAFCIDGSYSDSQQGKYGYGGYSGGYGGQPGAPPPGQQQ